MGRRAPLFDNIRSLERLVFPVSNVCRATPSTRIVRLSLGTTPFRYVAGQAALLGIPGQPARIPYSIASAPEETKQHRYLEFLLKLEAGDWPAHLAGLRRGSKVALQGPTGSFVFPQKPKERHFVFVAGGTGIAPLRSMIAEALMTGQDGKLHLLYSARTPKEFAYLRELRRHAREQRLELALTTTREVPPRWRGGRGRITPELLSRLVETPETLCFVCGPAAMVDSVPAMLVGLGIESKRVRIEEW